MDIGSVVLLSNELALRRQVEVIANNLANAQTSGFKRETTVFRSEVERMNEAPSEDLKQVYQVLDYGTVHDTSDGVFQPTGNPMDLAIVGQGYFGVQLADGSTAYTRAGALRVSADGFLETAAGKVLGEGGSTIQVPPEDAARLSIARDGTVAGRTGPLGRVVVFSTDEATADPRGDALFSAGNPRELQASETRLRIGGTEGSNVQPVIESAKLIEAMRAYQSSQQMTNALGDLRRSAIERLGRIAN